MKRLGGCLLFVVVYIVTFFALNLLGLGGPNNSREAWAFLNHAIEMNRYMNREANPPLPEPLPPVSYSAASGLDDEPEPVASESRQAATSMTASAATETASDAESTLVASNERAATATPESSETLGNDTFTMSFPYSQQSSRTAKGENRITRRGHQLVVWVTFGEPIVNRDYTYAVDHIFDDANPVATAQRVAAGDYASLESQLRQQGAFHRLAKGSNLRYPVVLVTPYDQAETLRLDRLEPDELKTYQDERGQTWWVLYYSNHYLRRGDGAISVQNANP